MQAVRAELADRFAALAAAGTLAHSYLIVSKDAVSLEATARAIQQAIDGRHRFSLADGAVVEPDGSSIGIDQAREAREHLAAFPGIAPYRTALILQADLMTTEAQNALLKLAEEPAPRSVLLLAVSDEERLLRTLRSRLQRVPLALLPDRDVAAWLVSEKRMGEADAATLVARSAGSLALAAELSDDAPARAYAERLVLASGAQVAAIAKEAAAAEVRLGDLLRALSVTLAYTDRTARMRELWHRTQRLAAASQSSPLSLRLQVAVLAALHLERLQVAALFTDLPSGSRPTSTTN